MNVAKRSLEATSTDRGIPAEPLGGVAIQNGEAVVGPLTEILPDAFVPGDGEQAWLYFSVPKSTMEALDGAIGKNAIEVSAMLDVKESADLIWVRVRVFGHCVLVKIPANDESMSTALQTFARAGRVRILVATQSMYAAPLPIEVAWKAPTSTRDALALERDIAFLRVESEFTGSVSQLTLCTAETSKKWRERLGRESA